MAAPFIDVEDVALRYRPHGAVEGTLAVEGLSLSVAEGEFVAVVGPSGCGKSTLMKLVTGLQFPSAGTVRVAGNPVAGPVSIAGMAFQNPVMLPWRTTGANVLLPMEIVQPHRSRIRRNRAAYDERADALLASVGLEGAGEKFPWQLSGGMQQRASLCRALIHEPKLLMLDEPFAALDAFTREELWCVIRDLQAEKGFTTVLVTHDLREAAFPRRSRAGHERAAGPHPGRAHGRSAPPARSGGGLHIGVRRPRARASRPHRAGEEVAAMRINWVAAAPWICTFALFALWEGAVWLLDVAPYVLPAPSLIAYASWEFGGALWRNSVQTLWTTMAGFGIAVVFGLALGLFVGWDRRIYAGLYPLMVGFNSIPKVAVVPILVIWFGSGWLPAVLTAFLISFFPIVVNVATGLATIEPEMEDVLRALGAKKLDIMTQGRHPALAALLLRIAQDRHHPRVHRLGALGDAGRERGPRPHDADRPGQLRGAAGLLVPGGACHRGHRHVRDHGVAGDAHDRLGAPVRVLGAVRGFSGTGVGERDFDFGHRLRAS